MVGRSETPSIPDQVDKGLLTRVQSQESVFPRGRSANNEVHQTVEGEQRARRRGSDAALSNVQRKERQPLIVHLYQAKRGETDQHSCQVTSGAVPGQRDAVDVDGRSGIVRR